SGLVSMPVWRCRELKLDVLHVPITDNPHHGEVIRTDSNSDFSASVKHKLRHAAKWVRPMAGVRLHND
ncbi:MAG: hypothetical protein ACREUQ_07325, partial [Burkholderiales bacterium]